MATALRPLDPPDPAAEELDEFLCANQSKSLLRFITCGSVDDGKSTLIGRLLHDSKQLLDDQLAALERDSRGGETLDFALLVDGLAAEREQGITIDVAYRFFATDRRKFVVADTPGHEQYTRNMATGASTADLAVILIDARKGVLPQTRRHSRIVHLLGIRKLVLAVNKMDLIGFSRDRFDAIVADYRQFADEAGIGAFVAIPVSGLGGDNVTRRSAAMDWYAGPTLLDHLEQVPAEARRHESDGFRMAVQWVNRPDQNFRGYAGTIATGRVRVGDRVRILPSGRLNSVARIVTFDGDLSEAVAGQAVTLLFSDEVDCSRGDLIAGSDVPVEVSDRLDATMIWMAGEAMVPGRAYWLKIGTQTVAASVGRVTEGADADLSRRSDTASLALNDIGRCEIMLDRPIAALTYAASRRLGGFILIDRASHQTLAAGMIRDFPRDASTGASQVGHGRIVRLTGAPEAQRGDFARIARKRLLARGRPSFVLDAATLREGLASDLGTGPEDSAELGRRAVEVARILSRAGVTALMAIDPPAGKAALGTELNVSEPGPDWDWII